MKKLLVVVTALFSGVAQAAVTDLEQKLSSAHPIYQACVTTKARNQQIAERTKNSLVAVYNLQTGEVKSGVTENVEDILSRAEAYNQLTTQDTYVRLARVDVNAQANLQVDVNCEKASLQVRLFTFVNGKVKLQNAVVSRLAATDDDMTEIVLEDLKIPVAGIRDLEGPFTLMFNRLNFLLKKDTLVVKSGVNAEFTDLSAADLTGTIQLLGTIN